MKIAALTSPLRRTIAVMFLAFAGDVMAADAGSEKSDDARLQAMLAKVGREIFVDPALSNPQGQSCLSCHQPASAFADKLPVSQGAVTERSGHRNATSLMYAALIPNLEQEDFIQEDGEQIWLWQGGLFQDGSARTLHEQVKRPFFGHAEMNVGSDSELSAKLRKAPYAERLKACASNWKDDAKVNHTAYRALVEFLKEPMFRPFDARIDDYLAGKKDALNAQEKRGLAVFQQKGKCADCHLLHASVWSMPLLSDFGYDNLGAPSRGEKDPGLGGHTGVAEEMGQFRAPSLRNVALTAPYLHNGSLATLKDVMEFYNRRDKEPQRWGTTDYPATVNHTDSGNLGLSDQEVDDLVALMDAFTDRSLISMQERGDTFPMAPPGTPDTWKMRAYFPDWNHAVPPLPPHPPHRGPASKSPNPTLTRSTSP